MPTATYVLEVDWDGDGSFGHANSDITADLIRLRARYGRDRADQLVGASVAGTLEAHLWNIDGDYNRFNTSSPIFGDIKPSRRIRLRTTSPSSATLWSGYLQSIEPEAQRGGNHRAVLRAAGPLSQLAAAFARVAETTSIATGDAVDDVLDAVQWSASLRDVDTGQTTMSRWRAASEALTALRDLAETEGGFLRESRAGEIVFEDRHRRLQSPHDTVQATYSDDGADIGYATVRQRDPIRGVFNRILADVTPYTVGGSATLWTLSEATAPGIEPGDTVEYWARYPLADSPTEDVGAVWTTPVATTDYQGNSQAGGGGDDHTGDLTVAETKFADTMKLSITNGAAVKVYLTLLQARGTPVSRGDVITVSAEDADSIADFGEREYPLRAGFIPDTEEALAHCRFTLAAHAQETPRLSLSYEATHASAKLADALAREVSDRVHVESNTLTAMGVDEDFFIEAITHDLVPPVFHRVTLEVAPASGYSGYWVIGVTPGAALMKLAY